MAYNDFQQWWDGYSPERNDYKQIAEDAWTAARQSIFNPRFKEGEKVGEHVIESRWTVNGQWFYRVDSNIGSVWSQDELAAYQRVQSTRS